MKYESIKSMLLVVLVLVSFVLTWSLWTYQPKYEFIQNTKYIQDVSVSNRKVEVSSLIQPVKILYHQNDQHFGTTETVTQNKLMEEMKNWNFSDITNISSSIADDEFLSFIHGSGNLELVYSDELPMNVFQSIFQISNEDVRYASFDRLVIHMDEDKHDKVTAYFVSYENNKIYEAQVKNASIQTFEEINHQMENEYQRYLSFDLTETKKIFLPADNFTMYRLQYYTDLMDPNTFKNALFSDPTYVKKDFLPSGEVYTDGSRLMRIDSDQLMMQYVNPASADEYRSETSTLIQSSIDYVNDHGGWTDTYRFSSWDSFEQKTVFRLYSNNYPVYSSNGMSEIIQVWGNNEIFKYERPLFNLDLRLDRGKLPITLPSGIEVIEVLREMKDFDPELLEDITIGYELVSDPLKSKVFILEPIWSFRYAGSWNKVIFNQSDESGGNVIGLE